MTIIQQGPQVRFLLSTLPPRVSDTTTVFAETVNFTLEAPWIDDPSVIDAQMPELPEAIPMAVLVFSQDGRPPRYIVATSETDLRRRVACPSTHLLRWGCLQRAPSGAYIFTKKLLEREVWEDAQRAFSQGYIPAAWVMPKTLLKAHLTTVQVYSNASSYSEARYWGYPIMLDRRVSEEERFQVVQKALGPIDLTMHTLAGRQVVVVTNPAAEVRIEGVALVPDGEKYREGLAQRFWWNDMLRLSANETSPSNLTHRLFRTVQGSWHVTYTPTRSRSRFRFNREYESMSVQTIDRSTDKKEWSRVLLLSGAIQNPAMREFHMQMEAKMEFYGALRRSCAYDLREHLAHILETRVPRPPSSQGRVSPTLLDKLVLRQDQLAMVEDLMRRETSQEDTLEHRLFFKLGMSECGRHEVFCSPCFERHFLHYYDGHALGFRRVDELRSPQRGGLIVAPMGFGKTVLALSLVVSAPTEKPTIIVCPEAVVSQWGAMCRLHAPQLAWTVFTGKEGTQVDTANNILFVSYKTLKKHGGNLSAMEWGRVIFDEAHLINACHDPDLVRLKAPRVWGMTATPHNRVVPIWHRVFLCRDIPGVVSDIMLEHFCVLPPVLDAGPSWTVTHRMVPTDMPPSVRTAYDAMERECLARGWELHQTIARNALHKVAVGFCNALPPYNRTNGVTGKKREAPETMYDDNEECPICMDSMPGEIKATIRCGHVFCKKCLVGALLNVRKCPICRDPSTVQCILGVEEARALMAKAAKEEQEEVPPLPRTAFDTYRLVAAANLIRAGAADDKYVVFSRFKPMLQQCARHLRGEGIGVLELFSSRTPEQNVHALESFAQDAEARVLLIDLVWGNAGLNLTTANRLIFLEPPMKAEQKEQAVGRLARHGQMRPVFVDVLADSVEGV